MKDYNNKVAMIEKQQQINLEAVNKLNEMLARYTTSVFEEDVPSEAQIHEEPAIICKDDIVTFVKPNDGRVFTYYTKNNFNVTRFATQTNNYLSFDKDLLNKVVAKMLLAPQLDRDTLRALCSYINRENPTLDICEHVIPLLAKAIQKVAKSELGILFLQSTKLYANINDMKSGKYKAMPNNLYEAFKAGRTTEYITYMIRDTLGINTTNNPNSLKLGF